MQAEINSQKKIIEITGDTTDWIIVARGRKIDFQLVEQIASLNPAAFYRFGIAASGQVFMEQFYAAPEKERWN